MLKNGIPQVQRIPQYRNSGLIFPKYRTKNGPIPQYRKPQCPPLYTGKPESSLPWKKLFRILAARKLQREEKFNKLIVLECLLRSLVRAFLLLLRKRSG